MEDDIGYTESGGALVGDDEEYSYSGYSDDSQARAATSVDPAYYAGDDEDHSYTGYSDEDIERFAGEAAVTNALRSGDFIVEEFSPVSNAKAVHKFAHLSEDNALYILSTIYIVVGILCVSIAPQMSYALPYIVGALMAVGGVIRFIFAVIQKEYVHTHSNKTASSLILMALSVIIIIDREWASAFIPTVWGILGLFESAHAFNHAFSRIARGMNCSYYLVKGIIELVLAFLLMYDPLHHINLHIVVFGIQLIFRGLTSIPALKRLLSRR